ATSFTGDLICTDCLTATEITDVYVLNTSDTMSGTLGVTGVITATGGVVGALTGHSSSDLALTGGTMSGDIVMGNGVAIGQAAGPLVEFDDTNNYLEIMGGNVGIGTTSPGYPLTINATSTDPATTVQGIYSTNAITLTANNAQTAVASFGNLTYDQGGFNATTATNRGLWGRAVATGASGTITGLAGVAGNVINSGSGTISNAYGFYAVAPTNIGGGTITDSYGLYI
ncbi:MAG: hypothetical protein NT149_03715, partial [Candidatus Gottesmanbacteria bacterium]|nr:hypothetical protein [Candidatus Gottesmanbacteria bacterium]